MIHCVKDADRLSKVRNEKCPLDLASWWGMARAVLAQWESESDWRGLKNGLVMLLVNRRLAMEVIQQFKNQNFKDSIYKNRSE